MVISFASHLRSKHWGTVIRKESSRGTKFWSKKLEMPESWIVSSGADALRLASSSGSARRFPRARRVNELLRPGTCDHGVCSAIECRRVVPCVRCRSSKHRVFITYYSDYFGFPALDFLVFCSIIIITCIFCRHRETLRSRAFLSDARWVSVYKLYHCKLGWAEKQFFLWIIRGNVEINWCI